jgi:hypothetical protein
MRENIMKLNKTLINKIVKASDIIVATSNVYEFRSDEFTLRVSREQVDLLTSAVASKSVEGDIGITDFRGHQVFIPADLSKYVAFTSKDKARPLLCAVNFTRDEIQATDSYRLIVGSNSSGIVGIYDAFALELACLVDSDRMGYAEADGGIMQFGSIVPSDGSLTVFPVSGEYPNVHGLLVEGETSQLVVCDLPRSVVNRHSHINKDLFGVFFRDKLLISAFNGVQGQVEVLDQVTVNGNVGFDGDEVQAVAFNYKYLKCALDVLPSKGVYECLFQGVRKPLQISDGGYTVLVMPTMLKSKVVDREGVEIVDAEQTYPRFVRESVPA